jgi:hypothetical protein
MHTTLKQYPGFGSTTNYEGYEVDLEMEVVLTLGMTKMVLEILPLLQGGVRDDDGSDFPLAAAVERQDQASPEVEEGFRLRLRKF